jgi:hypothetical protein
VSIEEARKGVALVVRVVVRGLASSVALRPEGLGTRFGKAIGTNDVQIGAPDFDGAVFVEGLPLVLHALLDGDTRKGVMNALGGRVVARGPTRYVDMKVEILDGELHADFPVVVSMLQEPQEVTLRSLLELSHRLREPEHLLVRLANNVRSDPEPGVRRACLRVLHLEAAAATETQEVLTTSAREDADVEVRLEAATLLGEGGTAILAALATDASVEDSVSARAIERLDARIGLDPARRILEEAVSGGRRLTAIASARALGAIGSADAEPALLAALADEAPALQAAAADALARVGTTLAVLPLRRLEASVSGSLQKAAREAIVRIQARREGAGPGQLALSGTPQGHVSLADDARGRVGLPERPDAP